MIITHHIIEHGTRIQLLFRQACDDRISIFDTLLIDDPYPHAVAGKSRRDSIRYGIDIVRYQDIHHDAAAGCQAGADGIAGLDTEVIVELKTRTADIDCDAVVKSIVLID